MADDVTTAVLEMAAFSGGINAPASRVNLAEWVRRLTAEEDRDLRQDYVQYLRVLVRHGILHGPFRRPPPPTGQPLAPLAETLCNDMCDKIPELPRVGAMQPFLMHRTADGAAYLAAKSIPGKGVFCYLAVNPNTSAL